MLDPNLLLPRRVGELVHRLVDQDALDGGGVLDRVGVAVAPVGDVREQLAVRLHTDRDGGDGDFLLSHAEHEVLVLVGVGAAVRDQDDVPDLGLDRRELIQTGFERRIEVRLGAGLDAVDAVGEPLLLAHELQRDDLVGVPVEGDQAEAVLLVQHAEGSLGRLLGQVHLRTLHAVGLVQRDHQCDLAALLLDLEVERQHAFER